MSEFLVARGLVKSYAGEAPVLDGVDVDFAAGSMVAVVGPSGCGKSTLLHLLGAIDRPDRGSVRLCGVDYATLGDDAAADLRAQRIGFVFQFDHLLPELDLAENVAVPLRLAGIGGRPARERAEAMLERVGLAELRRRLPRELSGGERQRGAVARALIHDPQLLLADEPTGNLDGDNAARVLALLRDLARQPGRVVVVVTHDPAIAAGCDGVYRLGKAGLSKVGDDACAATE